MSLSRRQFLSIPALRFNNKLLPPWASRNQFGHLCDQCGACIAVCPESLLRRSEQGYPEPDFNRSACTFCRACVKVCDSKALDADSAKHAWNIRGSINVDSCVSFQGVECRSCIDYCAEKAISVHPQPGGISLPSIDAIACNGCGGCVQSCPGSAIEMKQEITQ